MSRAVLNVSEYQGKQPWKRWKCSKARRHHRMLTLEALRAAAFKCVRCGATKKLTIHHITRIKGQRDKREVLCRPCHDEHHNVQAAWTNAKPRPEAP